MDELHGIIAAMINELPHEKKTKGDNNTKYTIIIFGNMRPVIESSMWCNADKK